MKRTAWMGALAVAAVLAFATLAVQLAARWGWAERAAQALGAGPPAPATELDSPYPREATGGAAGFLFGTVVTTDGAVHEGRLRWGGREEAFWGDFFNGTKAENPWAPFAPREALVEPRSIKIWGFELARWERPLNLRKPFMARFGDIRRIEVHGRDIRVTLKSGTVFRLDLFEADDLADGLRVWRSGEAFLDVEESRIRSVVFHASTPMAGLPIRLHGTVYTQSGMFTGYVQWNRTDCVGSDFIEGVSPEGRRRIPFGAVRAIAREAEKTVRVRLFDGMEIVLSGTQQTGDDHRGVYVDDPRYGRVLISWEAFERVEFSPGGSGPGYDEFPPGRRLTGTVLTRNGRLLRGRIIFDLDESETTETLDAPASGVDYRIPMGRIASIVLPGNQEEHDLVRVVLHGGETLQLEREGDLGEENLGLLVFLTDAARPEYVPWREVVRITLDAAPVP